MPTATATPPALLSVIYSFYLLYLLITAPVYFTYCCRCTLTANALSLPLYATCRSTLLAALLLPLYLAYHRWVFLSSLKFDAGNSGVALTSPRLYSSITSSIFPGNLYCKV